MKKALKIFGGILCGITGLLVVVQVILLSPLPARLIGKYAPLFIDGRLDFSRVNVNVFKKFPYVSVTLEDATLTYPDSLFAEYDARYPDAYLLTLGRDTLREVDTLASFHRFTAAVDLAALTRGRISVKYLDLSRPRIFAKMYNDSTANWNIFKTGAKDTTDTVSSGMPDIYLRRVVLDEYPAVVFCMPEDSLLAGLYFKEMSLKGSIKTWDIESSRGRFAIDSLGVAGLLGRDTLLFGLDRLDLRARDRKVTFGADARAYSLTHAFGETHIPFHVDLAASLPDESPARIVLEKCEVNVAEIPLEASGEAVFYDDSTYIKATADIHKCKLDYLLNRFAGYLVDEVKDVEFTSALEVHADCDGAIVPSTGAMPRLDIALKQLMLNGANVNLDANAKVEDFFSDDALIDLDANLDADLGGVTDVILRQLGIEAAGDLAAHAGGKIRKNQLSVEKFAKANVDAWIRSNFISVDIPADTLKAEVSGLSIALAPTGNKYFDEVGESARMLALEVGADSLKTALNTTHIKAKELSVKLQNSAEVLTSSEKKAFYPFNGELYARRISLRDVDSTYIMVRKTRDNFRVAPKRSNPLVPVLNVSSSNDMILYRAGADRCSLRDVDLKATAVMSSIERKLKAKAFVDSLAKANPTVPRDSLRTLLRGRRPKGDTYGVSATEIPEWLSEEDFKKQDIHIDLGESLTKYYREWDINGSLAAGKARLTTPSFPVRTAVNDLDIKFNNDAVDISSLNLEAGESNLSLDGSLSGLRRFIAGRGILDLEANLNSSRLNLNELLAALDAGAAASDAGDAAALNAEDISDTEYEEMVMMDGYEDASTSRLVVVPANINAKVNLDATDVEYAGLNVTTLGTRLVMKERCLQITNTVATTDFANLFAEGFYSTKTKKDISAGFSLSIMDVSAEDVIEHLPALDTIVPVMKSFSGLLNCEVAATAKLDTLMNLDMSSVSGVVRLTGQDMEIYDSEEFRKLAKLLLFRDKKHGYVDELAIEGYLADNKFEVFPFVLSLDRYRLALSGVQNLDSSFRYHASVLKSPIWFKFGIDLWGDFDKSKFKIGRPKYRNTNVPVFSKVIDTTRINLSESIHHIFEKGVDAAIAENEKQKAISDFKSSRNYVQAIDMPLDTLSGKELRDFDSLSVAPEIIDEIDTLSTSPILTTEQQILSSEQ